ncbi:MAG: glucosaminidase domain-containing protein [Acidobacteriaceae bacterium]
MSLQTDFLTRAVAAARRGGHIFPEMAACEAALESGWGLSRLVRVANNLFGQKQDRGRNKGVGTLALPTREYLHGRWVSVDAFWVRFPDWAAAFAGRMEILRALSSEFPAYAHALQAANPEQFVQLVSERWSTDPERARKVLSIYDEHQPLLASLAPPSAGLATVPTASGPAHQSQA